MDLANLHAPRSIWARLFPFMSWITKMNRETLKADFIAGLTVSLVAIPQSLAYAQLAGVPAYYGLYASLVPVIIGALWGSSPALSTGPVAMTSLLTAASIMTMAPYGTEQFYTYVTLMALLSGLFQMALGIGRMGVLLNFLSYPVLRGFINAAAIIIALAQLPAMLSIPRQGSKHFLSDILHVIENFAHAHMLSLVFGLSALVALALLKKYAPKLPGVLIVVAIATFASYMIGFEASGGHVVGTIPAGLPDFGMPEIDVQASIQMLPTAFIIAVISFMEAMSSSKIIAIKTRTEWDENQELVGQGLAKVAAAFSHSMPVSGSFSRSALNLASGARTGMASIFSALFVLITLLFFTKALYHLPKPVLAAVIMMAVYGLIDFSVFKQAWKVTRSDGMAAVVTFIATLLFAPQIHWGILTGILLSLVLYLMRTMKPEVVVLGMDQHGMLRNARRHNLPRLHPKITAIRFDGPLYFANVSYFEQSILYLISNDPDVKFILIVGYGITSIDASGVEMLKNLLQRLKAQGITLVFSSLSSSVRDILIRSGVCHLVGEKNVYISKHEAVKDLMRRVAELEEEEKAQKDTADEDGGSAAPATANAGAEADDSDTDTDNAGKATKEEASTQDGHEAPSGQPREKA